MGRKSEPRDIRTDTLAKAADSALTLRRSTERSGPAGALEYGAAPLPAEPAGAVSDGLLDVAPDVLGGCDGDDEGGGEPPGSPESSESDASV